MIIGIGTDIVQISRIEQIFNKYGFAFLKRILHPVEIIKVDLLPIPEKINFLAKRFAGKEAISKAIGTGIASGLEFKDIIINNDQFGKPYVDASYMKFKVKEDNFKIHISLADDYPSAIAFAVIST